jgi:hypothetical protein
LKHISKVRVLNPITSKMLDFLRAMLTHQLFGTSKYFHFDKNRESQEFCCALILSPWGHAKQSIKRMMLHVTWEFGLHCCWIYVCVYDPFGNTVLTILCLFSQLKWLRSVSETCCFVQIFGHTFSKHMAKAHVIESLIPSYFALDYVTVSLEWPDQQQPTHHPLDACYYCLLVRFLVGLGYKTQESPVIDLGGWRTYWLIWAHNVPS